MPSKRPCGPPEGSFSKLQVCCKEDQCTYITKKRKEVYGANLPALVIFSLSGKVVGLTWKERNAVDVGPAKKPGFITTLPLAASKSFSVSEYPVPFLEHGWATPTSEVIVGLNKRLTHRKCSCAVACVVRIGAMLIALGNKSCRC